LPTKHNLHVRQFTAQLHHGHCGLTKLTSIVSKLVKNIHQSAEKWHGICRVCYIGAGISASFNISQLA